jgi:hypothetical protein
MRKFYLLIIAILLLGASPSHAGVISIEAQITTQIKSDTLFTTVTVTNRGDEAADNIQIETQSPTTSQKSAVLPTLPVGKSHSETFSYPLQGLLRGRYPYLARIDYTDTNLYPFSALAFSLFNYQENASSYLLGTLGNTKIEKNGRIELSVKNLDARDKQLTIELITPRELSVDHARSQSVLSAGAESTISFSMRNFSALQGSTYAVFALIQYEDGGTHFTTLAPGTVIIGPPGFLSTLQKYQTPLIALSLAFGFLIFGRIYWEKKMISNPRRD